MSRLDRLLLEAALDDRTFERVEWRGRDVWAGKCIHCSTTLLLELDGRPIGKTSLEHIVPRAHGGTDAVENLALACRRCNNQKGRRHDTLGPRDVGYQRVVDQLQARRAARRRSGEGSD